VPLVECLMIFEWCDFTLDQTVKSHGNCDVDLIDELASILQEDILPAIAFIHKVCIVHCDIKGGNILGKRGNLRMHWRLSDFDLQQGMVIIWVKFVVLSRLKLKNIYEQTLCRSPCRYFCPWMHACRIFS